MIAVEMVIGVPLSISTGTLPAGLNATTPSDCGEAGMWVVGLAQFLQHPQHPRSTARAVADDGIAGMGHRVSYRLASMARRIMVRSIKRHAGSAARGAQREVGLDQQRQRLFQPGPAPGAEPGAAIRSRRGPNTGGRIRARPAAAPPGSQAAAWRARKWRSRADAQRDRRHPLRRSAAASPARSDPTGPRRRGRSCRRPRPRSRPARRRRPRPASAASHRRTCKAPIFSTVWRKSPGSSSRASA